MAAIKSLPRRWFERPAVIVAPALLGHELNFIGPTGPVGGIIVETEAYHQNDPASHTFRGRRGRNVMMFGPAGYAYVYFTYGLHHCLNLVTGPEGVGEAVLIRALEPTQGLATMMARRGTNAVTNLCRGPANLTQALGLNLDHNGLDLISGPLRVLTVQYPVESITTTPRIGISHAQDQPWRFLITGNQFVSGPRVGIRP